MKAFVFITFVLSLFSVYETDTRQSIRLLDMNGVYYESKTVLSEEKTKYLLVDFFSEIVSLARKV